MSDSEIFERLCVYDRRSPYFIDQEDREACSDCFCDNCFYGRHKLALEVLRLKGLCGEEK